MFHHRPTVNLRMIQRDAPRSGQTTTGYGSKMPTPYMVNLDGRLHRVYCMCYSNAGTCYIVKNGEVVTVDQHEVGSN